MTRRTLKLSRKTDAIFSNFERSSVECDAPSHRFLFAERVPQLSLSRIHFALAVLGE